MAPPPMLFDDLLCYLDGDTLFEVKKLLKLKAVTSELGESAKIVCINDYIEQKLDKLDVYIKTIEQDQKKDWKELNELFLSIVM